MSEKAETSEEKKLREKEVSDLLVEFKRDKNVEHRNHLSSRLYELIDPFVKWRVQKRFASYLAAHRSRNGDSVFSDLVNSAWVSIMSGIGSYDPEKGAPSTFLVPYIDKGAQEYIYEMTGSSQYYTQQYFSIRNAVKTLEDNGVNADPISIHIATQMPYDTMKRSIDLFDKVQSQSSLDDPLCDGNRSVMDTVASPESIDDCIMKIEVKECIEKLPDIYGESKEKVRFIVKRKYFFGDTIEQISELLSIPAKKIGNIIREANKYLRKSLMARGYGEDNRQKHIDVELNDDNIIPFVVDDDYVSIVYNNNSCVFFEELESEPVGCPPTIDKGSEYKCSRRALDF